MLEQTRVDATTHALIANLESCQLSSGFPHHDHVRVAWGLLQGDGLPRTLERFPQLLRRFAASVDADGLYHETITWTFLFLIHQRIHELPQHHSWEDFAAESGDLLHDHRATLLRHYPASQLESELARRTFVMPITPREEQTNG